MRLCNVECVRRFSNWAGGRKEVELLEFHGANYAEVKASRGSSKEARDIGRPEGRNRSHRTLKVTGTNGKRTP